MTRTIRNTAIVLVAALVATGGMIAIHSTGSDAQVADDESTSSIELTDQTSDNRTVIVDSVTLAEAGFVVIHDDTFEDDGSIDSVIGVSRHLEAGEHRDVPVTLAEPLDDDSVTVVAVAHRDTNGNEVFDFVSSDGEIDDAFTEEAATIQPVTPTETEDTNGAETDTENESTTETETEPGTETETETGTVTETDTESGTETTETETEAENQTDTEVGTDTESNETDGTTTSETAVQDSAVVTVDNEVGPRVNLTFEDQDSNGSSVSVENVTMYRGGYLVIHDETLDQGDDVGSVVGATGYLEPGTYEGLEVQFAQPLNESGEANVTLVAMPHHETNGNLVNDFVISDGEIDGPYTSNGTAVTAEASVTVETNETTTTTGGTEA